MIHVLHALHTVLQPATPDRSVTCVRLLARRQKGNYSENLKERAYCYSSRLTVGYSPTGASHLVAFALLVTGVPTIRGDLAILAIARVINSRGKPCPVLLSGLRGKQIFSMDIRDRPALQHIKHL